MALEFLLKLQDMMTPKLGQSLQQADKNLARFQANAVKGTRSMGTSFEQLQKRVEQLRETAQKTTDWRVLKDATRQANDLEKQMDRLERKASGMKGGGGSFLGGFGKIFGAAAVGYGAFNLGKDAIQLAAEREKQRVNFQVMTGNRETGNDLLQKVIHMADVTPFESQDLIGNAKMLMQYGLSVNNVMPALQRLGDISGADKEKMESLTMAYGKVISEGKLNGRALEEMIYAGYNPLNDIAKKTGLSMEVLRKRMEKGAISAKMVEDAMSSATGTGGRFHDLMEKQSQTLAGRYSTLMDNWHHKLTDIGEAMMPVAEGLMNIATKSLEWLNIGKSEGERLTAEKYELNELVGMITSYNQKSDERALLLTKLENKYPEFLNGLDKEKVTNEQLANALHSVNQQYEDKIKIANSSQLRDAYKKLYNSDFENYIKYSSIASAYEHNDVSGAHALMSGWDKFLNWGNFTANNASRATHYKKLAASYKGAADTEREGYDKYNEETGRNELAQRIDNINILLKNSTELASKISDKNKRNKFLELGKHFNVGGNKYNPSVMRKMEDLMGTSSSSATGGTAGGDEGMGSLKDTTSKAMSGQREITINIQKLGIDKFEQHVMNTKEGVPEIERMIKEMFLRIVYSAQGLSVN